MAFELETEELERIQEENDGLLTVSAVVEAARDESSPLHRHFDWNDESAGEKYREWQARTLIQKCKVRVEARPEVMVRAFVSVPTDRKEGGYRAVQTVIDSDAMRDSLLTDMKKRITYWQVQYYLFSGELVSALKDLERTIDKTRAQYQEESRHVG